MEVMRWFANYSSVQRFSPLPLRPWCHRSPAPNVMTIAMSVPTKATIGDTSSVVGWKVSSSATASFVLDALEQAIHARRPTEKDALEHHSDRGS